MPERGELPTSVLYELPACVLIFDAAGELRLVTRRAEELLGLPSDEIAAGLRDSGISAPGAALVSKLLSSALADPIRLELERPDESRAEIEGCVTRVGGSTIVTLEDVSARERRERAERDFVTNAAHELQTPLAAITSAVQVLQAGAKDNVADRDRFLAHVEAACGRLDRLARALLVLARAQTGVERPRQEIVPVAALLSSVADGLAPGRKVDVDCAADVAVLANRPLLEQALANLGQNAAKHSRRTDRARRNSAPTRPCSDPSARQRRRHQRGRPRTHLRPLLPRRSSDGRLRPRAVDRSGGRQGDRRRSSSSRHRRRGRASRSDCRARGC